MQDRRAYTRHAVRIEGKLISTDMDCCVDVVIQELSEGGALVSSAKSIDFPRNGYLWVAHTGTLFQCELRWRRSNRLFGLRFNDESSRDRLRALIDACASGTQDRGRQPSKAMSASAA
jgi:PilZ domain